MLLIFFMVTTTFDKNAALKIQLPTASNTAAATPEDKLELLIDGQGRYYVNGREVLNNQPETLFQAMSQTLDEMQGTPPLVISADAGVNYQAVVTAMDIAGRLGLTNFSMATTQSTRKPQE
jgi:biopolymer transport protein ExbD